MRKHIITTGLGIVLTGCLIGAPLSAQAAIPENAAHSSVFDESAISWELVDWQAVANQARADGDEAGARDALEVRDYLAGVEDGSPQTRNIWTSIAKKAVLQILKHSVSKLPAKIRPYANKIINVVETIDSFQETAVVTALSHAGIPYDVSVATAQWIVFFVGL